MNKANPSRSILLRNSGAFVSLFSLAVNLLVIFVLPSRCSFVTSFILAIFLLLMLGGAVTFLVGVFLSWRDRRLNPA